MTFLSRVVQYVWSWPLIDFALQGAVRSFRCNRELEVFSLKTCLLYEGYDI